MLLLLTTLPLVAPAVPLRTVKPHFAAPLEDEGPVTIGALERFRTGLELDLGLPWDIETERRITLRSCRGSPSLRPF